MQESWKIEDSFLLAFIPYLLWLWALIFVVYAEDQPLFITFQNKQMAFKT